MTIVYPVLGVEAAKWLKVKKAELEYELEQVTFLLTTIDTAEKQTENQKRYHDQP